MAAKKRKQNTSLADVLFEESYRFSFFRAVRLLETLQKGKEPLGKTLEPSKEPVRFSVKPGFSFPPSEIVSLLKSEKDSQPLLSVAFMGLIGPSGVLPNWYNETADQRNRDKDFTLTSFFDIFHHRLLTLFYLAWKKNRITENYTEDLTGPAEKFILSLTGLGTSWLPAMTGAPEELFLYYSGMFSKAAPNAFALEAAVADIAGTQASIEQFHESRIRLGDDDRTCLGTMNAGLGVDAVIGSEVTDMQTGFRVVLGPMYYERYSRFLPSGDLAEPVEALTRFIAGIEYEFDIKVVLKKEDVPPLGLGLGYNMGQTTWLVKQGVGAKEDKYFIIKTGR